MSAVDEQVVYTDGSCFNNGSKSCAARAGYSVFFGDGDARNVSEPIVGEKHTNNVGELTGVLEALRRADSERPLLIVSDSTYVVDGLVGRNGRPPWYKAWQRNAWRKADGKPVQNRDLWQRLVAISKQRKFRMRWQKAHSGHLHNDAADRLAKAGARRALARVGK